MIILAVETATEACSAAVYCDGAVAERYRVAPREHNRLIMRMIEDVLTEAGVALPQVDAVAFGRGPGSFTGVRIATGVAQGIAFGADIPVLPVSTLAALAHEGLSEDPRAEWAFPCIDARMGEVYCAVYRREEGRIPNLVGPERVIPPRVFDVSMTPAGPGLGTGSGWHTYRGILTERFGPKVSTILPDRFPRAASVACLGARDFERGFAVPPEEALPVYLRNQVTRSEQKA